jgi:hypothetical protein
MNANVVFFKINQVTFSKWMLKLFKKKKEYSKYIITTMMKLMKCKLNVRSSLLRLNLTHAGYTRNYFMLFGKNATSTSISRPVLFKISRELVWTPSWLAIVSSSSIINRAAGSFKLNEFDRRTFLFNVERSLRAQSGGGGAQQEDENSYKNQENQNDDNRNKKNRILMWLIITVISTSYLTMTLSYYRSIEELQMKMEEDNRQRVANGQQTSNPTGALQKISGIQSYKFNKRPGKAIVQLLRLKHDQHKLNSFFSFI